MKKNILFVTEVGLPPKGTGHLVRSLNILYEIKNIKKYVLINNLSKNLHLKKISTVNILYYHNKKKINFEIFKNKNFIVIIDLFSPKLYFLYQIKKYFDKIILFDDLHQIKKNIVTTIKPQETYRNKIIYKKNNFEYLGSDYFLINNNYVGLRKKYFIRKNVKNIIVCLGGFVTKKNIKKVSNFLLSIIDNHINITFATGFSNINTLNINKRISIISKKDLSKILHKYDLCFTAGGFTKFELFCIGMPLFYIPTNEHQRKLSIKYAANGYGVYLSKIDNLKKHKNNYKLKIIKIINSYENRKKMYIRNRSLVDGKGLKRILNIIKNL